MPVLERKIETGSRRGGGADLRRQRRAHPGRDPRDDRVDAAGIGVHAVLQQQLRPGDHAIEEEGIEPGLELPRQRGIDRIEGRGIVRSHVARRQHAGEQHLDAGGAAIR